LAPNRRPTLRDVALEAGVSFKTVSRVVNGEGGVSDRLVARVEETVLALGYRPDDRARRLRQFSSEAATIGFVLVDVANPFFSTILRGIEEVAITRDCLVLAGSTEGSADRERQLIEAFVDRRVDGLIVVPSGSGAGTLQAELDRGTPVVFLDLESDVTAVDLIRSDHYNGAYEATTHLLSHGHRDIAYFGDNPEIFSAGLRLEGFRDAMAAAGLEPRPDRIVTESHDGTDWRQIVRSYLESNERPTALVSAQNFVTVGAVGALHDLDLQHSIAQVGFDDVELADVVEPGISVVPQQPRELGRIAAEMLFGRIDGDERPPRTQVLRSDLIRRGSGEIPPQG
jgi:LacI family transcriptional regulator